MFETMGLILGSLFCTVSRAPFLSLIGCFASWFIFKVSVSLVRSSIIDRQLQLPGPFPYPIIGNLRNMYRKGISQFDHDMLETYGPIVRFYEGSRLNILITDQFLIAEILSKRSKDFINRQVYNTFNIYPLCHGLPSLKNEEWIRVRKRCSLAFSDSMLEKLYDKLRLPLNLLDTYLSDNTDQRGVVEVGLVCDNFAAVAIIATLFGVETLSDEAVKIFTEKINQLRNPSHKELKFILNSLFPFLTPVLQRFGLSLINLDIIQYFRDMVQEVTGNSTFDNEKCDSIMSQLSSAAVGCGGLNTDELMGQALTFFVAGHHTTSSVLSLFIYHMAVHPHEQRRAFTEIQKLNTVNFRAIKNLPFIDACLLETMRLYSPTIRVDRVAQNRLNVNNSSIPPDTTIVIPLPSLHKDPSVFPSPNDFSPDRTPLTHPAFKYSFMPFGQGPRYCVGQRYAMMILRASAVELLLKYEISRSPTTEFPLQLKPKTSNRPANGIYVKIVPRAKE